MAKLTEVGEKKSCFTCKKEMICVLVKGQAKDDGGSWPDRAVWQTDGVAHYGFNKSLNKAFCAKSAQAGEEAGAKVTAPDKTHLTNIDLELGDVAKIIETATDGAKRMVVVLSAVETVCEAAGISHPAKIGMIFNQVCENRR